MALPVKTSMEDCEKIIAYLRSKPAGATVAEAKSVLEAKHLDPRKLRAYEFWQLVVMDDGRMRLTPQARDIGRDSMSAHSHYGRVIAGVNAYRSAIERAHHGRLPSLTVNDVAANWHDHQQAELGTQNETSIKDAVTCFFNLVEGAGLGKYVLGRQGRETRVDLDAAAVAAFVEAGPSSPPWTASPMAPVDESGDAIISSPDAAEVLEGVAEPLPTPVASESLSGEGASSSSDAAATLPELRVFITHGKNTDIVEQVETMLGVADVPFEVAIESETAAIPVPEKVLGAMRRCTAAIICVSVEEGRKDEAGNYTINKNVLIEIGAAFVLYNQRVILLWDKRLNVPSNLQGLYRCEFEGDEIGFKEVMRLMKAVKEFRAPAV